MANIAATMPVTTLLDTKQHDRDKLKKQLLQLIQPFRMSTTAPPFSHAELIAIALVVSEKKVLTEILMWTLRTFLAYHDAFIEQFSVHFQDPQISRRPNRAPWPKLPKALEGFWSAFRQFDLPLRSGDTCTPSTDIYCDRPLTIHAGEARAFLSQHLEPKRDGCFRFLDLPPELRNRVYENIFDFGRGAALTVYEAGNSLRAGMWKRENGTSGWSPPDLGTVEEKYGFSWNQHPCANPPISAPSLRSRLNFLAACHQIWSEGLPYFYELNTVSSKTPEAFAHWTRRAPSHVKYLSRVLIPVEKPGIGGSDALQRFLLKKLEELLSAMQSLREAKSLKDLRIRIATDRSQTQSPSEPTWYTQDSGMKDLAMVALSAKMVTVSSKNPHFKNFLRSEWDHALQKMYREDNMVPVGMSLDAKKCATVSIKRQAKLDKQYEAQEGRMSWKLRMPEASDYLSKVPKKDRVSLVKKMPTGAKGATNNTKNKSDTFKNDTANSNSLSQERKHSMSAEEIETPVKRRSERIRKANAAKQEARA